MSDFGSDATKRVSSARYPEQIDTASEDDDEDEEEEELVLDNDNWSSGLPERWDVLGLGQAMVIFCFSPMINQVRLN